MCSACTCSVSSFLLNRDSEGLRVGIYSVAHIFKILCIYLAEETLKICESVCILTGWSCFLSASLDCRFLILRIWNVYCRSLSDRILLRASLFRSVLYVSFCESSFHECIVMSLQVHWEDALCEWVLSWGDPLLYVPRTWLETLHHRGSYCLHSAERWSLQPRWLRYILWRASCERASWDLFWAT